MNITEPSAVILEPELAGLSVCQRIDRLASVCYQRPPRPTEEEAEKFCRHLIERGHFTTLEMSVVHLWIRFRDLPDSNYIQIEPTGETDLDPFICSGSIRAFREAVCGDEVHRFLAQHYPVLMQADGEPPDNYSVRFAKPHEIPWQHKHVAVRVICSRAISHQLVRHRPCSFLQESARYCRYDDGVTFIRPEWADLIRPEWAEEFDDYETWAKKYKIFKKQCYQSEAMYKLRRDMGLSPQQARGALIHDVKTELILYASLPEWLHIFKMRCAKAADPEMRIIMVPLREQFKTEYPEMWEEA